MTFWRALIIAILVWGLNRSETPGEVILIIFASWGLWQFTSDPLPAAVDRGLEAFKNRYQR